MTGEKLSIAQQLLTVLQPIGRLMGLAFLTGTCKPHRLRGEPALTRLLDQLRLFRLLLVLVLLVLLHFMVIVHALGDSRSQI